MKLVRPYIPIPVRLEVIARQLQAAGKLYDVLLVETIPKSLGARLNFLLYRMFEGEPYDLDHSPPLALRYIIDAEKGLYEPPANSVEHLIYRARDGHDIKTRIRGDHGDYSDLALIRRQKRREKRIRQGKAGKAERCSADLSSAEHGLAGKAAARAQPKGVALASRQLRSANRWPPKGSRPLQWKPR